jgi:hypothetical protein
MSLNPTDPSLKSDESSSDGVIFVGEKLAPFNPTSFEVVAIALTMLQITPNDIVFDLGCGDARFLVEVAEKLLYCFIICEPHDILPTGM